MGADIVGPTLLEILECADSRLVAAGRETALSRLEPGASVVWDNCCSEDGVGGQLWVRLLEIFPSGGVGAPFPVLDSVQSCGTPMFAARVGIGIMRCAHTIDDEGNHPADADMISDVLGTTQDMSILLGAINCCVPDIRSVQAMRVEGWTPGGGGGCVGGEWTIAIRVDWCGCDSGSG